MDEKFLNGVLGPPHTQDWRPVTIAIQQLSSVEKAETVQVYFTLEGEDPKAQKKFHGWKVYMDSYMAHYRSWFMVFGNSR